jgi:hypothetical protein
VKLLRNACKKPTTIAPYELGCRKSFALLLQDFNEPFKSYFCFADGLFSSFAEGR